LDDGGGRRFQGWERRPLHLADPNLGASRDTSGSTSTRLRGPQRQSLEVSFSSVFGALGALGGGERGVWVD
jgi:hypothetical protein